MTTPAHDRLAIVTGADSGMGKATAELLAAEGFDVGITFHTDEAGAEDTRAAVEQRGQRCFVTRQDLASPDTAEVVDELAGLTEKRHGRNYLKGSDVEVTLAASEGRDMAMAWATYHDAVTSARMRHTDQPQVNVALTQAGTRDLQGGKALTKKSSAADITPLTSQTLALWGAQRDDVKKPRRSWGTKAGASTGGGGGGWVM